MLNTVRMIIDRAMDTVQAMEGAGPISAVQDISVDADMPIARELATLNAIRMADMAGLGGWNSET